MWKCCKYTGRQVLLPFYSPVGRMTPWPRCGPEGSGQHPCMKHEKSDQSPRVTHSRTTESLSDTPCGLIFMTSLAVEWPSCQTSYAPTISLFVCRPKVQISHRVTLHFPPYSTQVIRDTDEDPAGGMSALLETGNLPSAVTQSPWPKLYQIIHRKQR